MTQSALQIVRTMSLEDVVYSLGINPDKFPHSLSDCFDMANTEKKLLTSKLSGFSRTLSGLIPKEIDNVFSNTNHFLSQFIDNEKLIKSAAYKEAPSTIEDGLSKAIGFLIVRDHEEAEKYPTFMEMRKAIEATKQVHKATARGSHKGANGQAIQDAITEMLASKNVVMLTHNQFLPFLDIASKMALLGDKKAKQALLTYHKITEEEING